MCKMQVIVPEIFQQAIQICENSVYLYATGGKPMSRKSGILMHISSLPSKYGIGTFGQAAYDFVDFLEKYRKIYNKL